jgi:AcrR family transcriptional regulator
MSSRPGDPVTRRRILDAALELITRGRGARTLLADVARSAGVSRQAIYLHFANRADLFLAVVRHADERRGLPAAVQRIRDAPTGLMAVQEMIGLQARLNPDVWPVARALEAVRREDEAAERSWQDRVENRLRGCRAIVERLGREGSLRSGLDPDVAADLLWTLTSLRTWEDLVLQRKWSPERYRRHISELAFCALTRTK